MAEPVIIIDAAAGGASPYNSGTKTLRVTGYCVVNDTRIGFLESSTPGSPSAGFMASLGTISVDGTDTVQIQNTDPNVHINLKITAYASRHIEGDGSAVSITLNSGSTTVAANGWDPTAYLTSGDSGPLLYYNGSDWVTVKIAGYSSTTLTLSADPAFTGTVAFNLPPASAVSNSTPISTITPCRIGGPKTSFDDVYTRKLYSNGSTADLPLTGGWTIWDKTDEAITAPNIAFLAQISTTAGLPHVIKGRSETDRTVLAWGGTTVSYTSGSTAAQGIIFQDIDFVCNLSSNTRWYNQSIAASFVNCRFISGTGVWTWPFNAHTGNAINCVFTTSSAFDIWGGLYDACTFFLSADFGNNGVASYSRCKFIGVSAVRKVNGYRRTQYINCTFHDAYLYYNGSSTASQQSVDIINNSFSFTTSYSGYAIQFASATVFNQFIYSGITGKNNNYYNCTGLVDTGTYPGAAATFTGTTNINPAHSSISTGDATNTALLGQGYPTNHPNTTAAMNSHIGSHAPSTGGSTIIVIEE